MTVPTYVYRTFDDLGLLLYVGCSKDVAKRLTQHRTYARWVPYMKDVTIEEFPSRDDALAAEASAIRSERPFFNAQPEHTALVQANRVKSMQAVSDLLARLGVTEPDMTEDNDPWWEAIYAAREAVSVLIGEKFPTVTDETRLAVYLAARKATEAGAA